VSRLRSTFWKSRQQVGARLKSLLFTQGLIEEDDKTRLSKQWLMQKLSEIDKEVYPSDFQYAVKTYKEEWDHLTNKVKEIEDHLKNQAKSEKAIHQIYTSVPGIGLIHARQLANELGDMSQFRNEKQLFSYTGLTPSEYSSGEHVRQGHISRQGRSVLRKILVEASWVAITKDPCLRKIYDRISRKSGGKRAIIGVARRLVGRIRSCLLSGKLYEIDIIEKKKENTENDINTINKKSISQEKVAA
jgi:transposase